VYSSGGGQCGHRAETTRPGSTGPVRRTRHGPMPASLNWSWSTSPRVPA